jgi:hypothetical protein
MQPVATIILDEHDQNDRREDSKCGTWIDLTAQQLQIQPDEIPYQILELSARLDTVRERSMLTPSGFFRLHWDESGIHAVSVEDLNMNGIPDYIDAAAVIFDSVRVIEVEELGYQAPPGLDGQPAIPYHIYFSLIPYYGITRRSFVDIPSLPGTNNTSFIEVHPNYNGFPTPGLNGLRVTAAHEFHHAIQFGYNYRYEDVYFFEMTSTWLEEFIYPDINDYIFYLDDLFDNVSNTRFNLFSGFYPYANSLYLQMITSIHGPQIVTDFWNQIIQEPSVEALATVLEENNSSWFESLAEYGLWLYYTGNRSIQDQFFIDAPIFPQVRAYASDKIEFNNVFQDDIVTGLMSNRFLEIYGVGGKILNIGLASTATADGGFRSLTPHTYSILRPINQQITSEPVDSDTLTLIITNSEFEQLSYSLSITMGGDVDITSMFPFPNPAILTQSEQIRFQNIPPDADLYIFSSSGKRVAVVENQGGSYIRPWYLKNDDGEKVSTGIYVYLVQGNGLFKTGKFSVIR